MVSSEEAQNIQKIIFEAQQEYIANLPATITLIRQLISLNDLVQFQEEFHKLKGTGKTYYLDEISVLSELIEKLCSTSLEKLKPHLTLGPQILEKIYQARKNNKVFDLVKDPSYQTLQQL